MWVSALIAFSVVFATAACSALFAPKKSSNGVVKPVSDFFLADQNLSQSAVVSLLLSSSFGLNGLFYQVWLGYTVGIWGLLIQGAWALSFLLLSPFSKEIQTHRSLHDTIGSHFGKGTRILAGICSILGISYMMGWEVAVGNSTLNDLFNKQEGTSSWYAEVLTSAIVFGCLLYTVLGGLRGNAIVDKILNIFKIFTITTLTVVITYTALKNSQFHFLEKLFPSFETMQEKLGWWGLLTNIAFSLAWQFVDNSTWQSVIGGANNQATASNLKWGGLAVFIAPGIVGTLLGVSLNSVDGINSGNILARAFESIAIVNFEVISIFMLITIIACIMSMIDGLFLASAFALIIDIFHPDQNFEQLDNNPLKAEKLLVWIRISLVVCAVFGVYGVRQLFDILNLSLFDFVYVLVIMQLSLIGSVLFSLFKIPSKRYSGYISILLSLFIGFLSVYLGSKTGKSWLTDGAGTFTIMASILVLITGKQK